MTSFFELARAFAGPVATILAASTAAWITYRLGRNQVRIAAAQAATAEAQKEIAKSQRDIAYDKLKWDLFGKRYEIYSVAGELIDHINSSTFDRPPGGPKIIGMLRKLDEARFFFPVEQASVFAAIGQLVERHEIAISSRNLNQDNEQVRIAAGESAAMASDALGKLRVQLPQFMEGELGFAQLTSRRE
jgi:hypothetical protein